MTYTKFYTKLNGCKYIVEINKEIDVIKPHFLKEIINMSMYHAK